MTADLNALSVVLANLCQPFRSHIVRKHADSHPEANLCEKNEAKPKRQSEKRNADDWYILDSFLCTGMAAAGFPKAVF